MRLNLEKNSVNLQMAVSSIGKENEQELVSYTVEGIAELMDDNSTSEEFDRFAEKEKERRAKNPEYAKHQEELEEILAFVDSLG